MILVQAEGLTLARGGRVVVEDVSFSVERGSVLAVTGPSGAGKSSVLRALAGLDPLAAGRVEIDGLVLAPGPLPTGARLRELSRRVGIVFQFHHLFAHLTAIDNLCLAPVHVLGRARVDVERDALAQLEALGVAARAAARPDQLSGGEAQRVAIARALVMRPPLLLMDEPTASLDAARRGELAALLGGLSRSGLTLIVSTHDRDFARAVAGRALVLESGRAVREGAVAEVF